MSTTFMKRCCGCLPCDGCCPDALPCFTDQDGQRRYVSLATGAEPVFSQYSELWYNKVIDFGFATEEMHQHLITQRSASTFTRSDGPPATCSFTIPVTFRADGYEKTGSSEGSCAIERAIDLESPVVPHDWCPQPGLTCRHVSFLYQPNPEGLSGWPERHCGNGVDAIHVSGVRELPEYFCGLDADLGGFPFGGFYDDEGTWWESWALEYIDNNDVAETQEISRLAVTAALTQNSALCIKRGASPECPA